MKVSVRQGRLTIDNDNVGLLMAAFDTAAETWLNAAASPEKGVDERKALLKMAGEAKALSLMIEAKEAEPDSPPSS